MSLTKQYSVFAQTLDVNEKFKNYILCKFGVEAKSTWF